MNVKTEQVGNISIVRVLLYTSAVAEISASCGVGKSPTHVAHL